MAERGAGTVKIELTDAGRAILGDRRGSIDVAFSGGPILLGPARRPAALRRAGLLPHRGGAVRARARHDDRHPFNRRHQVRCGASRRHQPAPRVHARTRIPGQAVRAGDSPTTRRRHSGCGRLIRGSARVPASTGFRRLIGSKQSRCCYTPMRVTPPSPVASTPPWSASIQAGGIFGSTARHKEATLSDHR